MRLSRYVLLIGAIQLTLASVALAEQDVRGEVFTCRFATHGTVVIDTREGSRSITYRGTRYPVQTGSYFFQGTGDAPLVNGDPIVISFGPQLDRWTFLGESSESCERRVVRAGSSASTSGADNRKLEGMGYDQARAIVRGYGWSPFPGPCDGPGVTKETCEGFPEVELCSGTGVGLCTMRFAKPERCLTLVTVGGPPASTADGEPTVRDVTFGEGPCR